mmetsp:Transcript_5830/g.11024  ORF Transcript_5830/g.11024 Transcript_5830/m.11024 type:complete len:626 (+) Transcript_5830:114-1991(+)
MSSMNQVSCTLLSQDESSTSLSSVMGSPSFVPSTKLSSNILETFLSLLFDPNITSECDKQRWFAQPIHTRHSSLGGKPHNIEERHYFWGLVQTHGGPCGVITAIQAEMIKSLKLYEDFDKVVSPQEAEMALCDGLGRILARCAVAPPVDSDRMSTPACNLSCVKIVTSDFGSDLSMSNFLSFGERLNSVTVYSKLSTKPDTIDEEIEFLAEATSEFLFKSGTVKVFGCPCGVILFLLSIVMTRGVETIQADMDDPSNAHLTAQFGHSSQELINLFLTGQASSNTFDNVVILGGGSLKCYGIQNQPDIGYLSQLEALRYCSVGSFYKSPKFPIWIIGSSSHFTVLFGSMENLKECESEILLEKCRRAFKSIENAEENGFIPVDKLNDTLKVLNLDVGDAVNTLAAALEMSGAGIVLWSDFWRATSRLLTGASLESVLNTNDIQKSSNNATPLMLTQFGESNNNTMESDEAMARRLAAEWGMDQFGKSDEELARELQAQFESNHSASCSNDEVQIVESQKPTSIAVNEDNHQTTLAETNDTAKDMEIVSSSAFKMYHYNCLRGGELSTFNVTKLTMEEAVGMSVPLVPTNFDVKNSSHCINDLESVVRTKYTSCRFDWGERKPPSLH